MHDGTINEERVACLDLTADETAKVSEAFDDAFQLGSLGLWVTLAAIAAGIAHPHERDAPDVRLDLQTPRSMSRAQSLRSFGGSGRWIPRGPGGPVLRKLVFEP
jgi:hypothetical protein